MKGFMATVFGLILMVGLAGMAVAGAIDSPGIPTTGSGMYTLSQIYDYLNSGTAASTPGVFQEPAGIPSPTMRTTRELYEDIKAKLDACTAGPADVKSGVKFFSTAEGSWGVQTGTGE
jgi:hypothetical protein